VEQPAEEWWRAVREATAQVMSDVDPVDVLAVGFSNAGGSFVGLDAQGRPVRPAIVWMDSRATRQGERLLADRGRDFWLQRTGQFLLSFWPVAKLPWLRENEPDAFERIACVLQGADYVLYRMTGRRITDRSNACATGFYNLRAGDWDAEILEVAQVSADVLPQLGEPGAVAGHVAPQAAAALGLRSGTPVVLGAWDQACAVIGAGSISGRDALLATGTAWVLAHPIQTLRIDEEARIWTARHALPGEYLFMMPMSNGGSVVEWYRRLFAGVMEDEEEADLAESGGLTGIPTGVADVPPGAGGVLFLPHLIGAAGPHWELEYSGGFLGLRHGTRRAQLFRAVLEAVAYETLWSLEAMAEFVPPASRLRMTGGATRSPVWPQIVADVTDMEVLIPQQTECAVLGAARLALRAVGCEPRARDEVQAGARLYRPDPDAVSRYRHWYHIYQQVHRDLKDVFLEMHRLHA
jgi:sugar (pentulose or hexulose) kinase